MLSGLQILGGGSSAAFGKGALLLLVWRWLLTYRWRKDFHELLQSWSEDEDSAQDWNSEESPQEDPV